MIRILIALVWSELTRRRSGRAAATCGCCRHPADRPDVRGAVPR